MKKLSLKQSFKPNFYWIIVYNYLIKLSCRKVNFAPTNFYCRLLFRAASNKN